MFQNPDAALFSISQACEIAGLKLATGRSWFQKGWLSLWTTDQKARVPGATTLISERSVLALAIAADLARLGAKPAVACTIARSFTIHNAPPWLLGERRKNGSLDAWTYLAAYPDGHHQAMRVVNSETETTPLEMVLFPSPDGVRRDGAWVIFLDFLVKRVEVGLSRAAEHRLGVPRS